MRALFRSLAGHNYRLWAAGAIVSNIGTWMQRTAQDWLVLTQLTHHNVTAVGVVTALQFAPQLLLLPLTGLAADKLNRRRMLFLTQAAMGLLALVLGLLTVFGAVHLWHVYACGLLLGCVVAFDSPIRQTFVSELVGEAELGNAVALNSTSFNIARMIGPAVAGVLAASVSCGWVFLINAASFAAVLLSLRYLRLDELHTGDRARAGNSGLLDGFRYIWGRADLKVLLFMLGVMGMFGLNFPIFISAMAVKVFHADADRYGLLTSMLAVGSVLGALFAASRARLRAGMLFISAALCGVGFTLAALMGNYWLYGLMLVLIGATAQIITTGANALIQGSTDPAMRGRVVAILFAVAFGGTPIGAPIVGWVADQFGPRWAMGVGAAAGFAGALVGAVWLLWRRPSSPSDAR
ncbi:Predicted arabinose efflux permease, MFS family [Andreprevotia lacus DSM 23236]|jgi:MFS family permease|uniref:Predicted arabinose efflux permease, MFS family n=1 Tax=Andreprevotia lacus DSM 23236 TaxID=1121001 RepID=A0A1W1X8V2_9NEIS|nr:MFS transporter [Andreprevotia lacus]SMC20349.1 Predicted arabinose efflux permease, MFS family [Andreprevotia lacus DSM 23236]